MPNKYLPSQPLPYILVGLSLVLLYLSPFFIYGQNLYIPVYDNLNSTVIWTKILAESGKIFSDSMDIIPNMLNGLPRLSYGTEFNMLLLLNTIIRPFEAYVANEVIIHIFSFFSMFILLSNYIIESDTKYRYLIILLVSLTFSLLPFWPMGGLSIPSQPLVLYAFLNIRHNIDTKYDWSILILIPFFSNFVLVYFFFLFSLSIFFLYETIKSRAINKKFLVAIFIMIAIYSFIEYRLIYNMFFNHSYISHRTEFSLHNDTFFEIIKYTKYLYLHGTEFVDSLQYPYIIILVFIALFASHYNKQYNLKDSLIIFFLIGLSFFLDIWKYILDTRYTFLFISILSILFWILSKRNTNAKHMSTLLVILSFFVFFSSFWNYTGWNTIGQYFPLVNTFHFSRFFFLFDLIWYILLALSLQVFVKNFTAVWLLLLIFLYFQIPLIEKSKQFGTYKDKEHFYVPSSKIDNNYTKLTYKSYYAKNLFAEIASFINKPKKEYRVVSVGIEPSISIYNGFYTIDGYSFNYPLSYKKYFRNLISKHLENRSSHRKEFDKWGSKCYLYGNYSIKPYYYHFFTSIDNFTISASTLRKMGVQYIISGYKILNAKEQQIYFLKKFQNPNSFWDIYLYKV